MAVVCLFPINDITWAYPFERVAIKGNTLATQSIFNPLVDEGIKTSAELEYELLAGIRLLLAGKSPTAVNSFLTKMYKKSSPETIRKIDFKEIIKKDAENITATFKVLGKDGVVFEIEYYDTVTNNKMGDKSIEDAGSATADSSKMLQYADVFHKNDVVKIRKVDSGKRGRTVDTGNEQDNMFIRLWSGRWEDSKKSAFKGGKEPSVIVEFVLSGLENAASQIKQGSIIDMGAGGRYYTRIIKEKIRPARMVALDYAVEPDKVKEADGIDVVKGRMENTGFDDGSFDAAVMIYSLEYASDSGKTVTELARILKDGGKAILVLHHPDSIIIQNKKLSLNFTKDALIPFARYAMNFVRDIGTNNNEIESQSAMLYAYWDIAKTHQEDIEKLCSAAVATRRAIRRDPQNKADSLSRFDQYAGGFIDTQKARIALDERLIDKITNQFRDIAHIRELFERNGLRITDLAGMGGIIRGPPESDILAWGIVVEKPLQSAVSAASALAAAQQLTAQNEADRIRDENLKPEYMPAIETSAAVATLVDRLVQEIGLRQAPAWMAQRYRPGLIPIGAEREGNDSIDGKIKQAKQHLILATQDPAVRTRAEQALELLSRHPRVPELMILEFEGLAHRLVKLITGNEQAYQEYKRKLDEAVQPLYLQIRSQLLEIPDRKQALRTAIIYAGIVNLLDITHTASIQAIADSLGLSIDLSKQPPSFADLQYVIDSTYTHVVNEETIIIDELEDFLARLEQSPSGGTILYFTDNHGEFIFDQLVIEQLLLAGYKVAVVSRGETVRDDVTQDEAIALLKANPNFAAFLADSRLIVTTDGSYFFGADLTQSVQHPEFLDAWRKSIGYIAKGAGNFQSLFGQRLSLPGLYIRMMKRAQNAYRLLEEARDRAFTKRTLYDLALVYQPEAPVSSVPITQSSEIDNVKKYAKRIHDENLKYTQTIPDKTILCHIITNSILPVQQRDMLKTLEQEMRNEKYSEKVVSLSVKDSSSPEEFMRELERIKAQEEARYQGYKVQFDVACPSKDLVGKIQGLGMQALAFTKEGDGDIAQVEGIILALRALQTGSINNLLNVYKLLTGRELTAGTNDINELARMMLFILPIRRVDVNQIGTLNRIIEENIKTAA